MSDKIYYVNLCVDLICHDLPDLSSSPLRLPHRLKLEITGVRLALKSKITPEPPLLETDLCPVDKPGRSPGARLRYAEWRPAGGINGSVGGGAARAVSQQSYCMEPKVDGPALARDLHGQIMSEDVRFLMRDTAGL